MGAEQSQDVAQPVPQAAWPAAGWHAHSVKYVVRATLSSQDVLPEYLKWLEETHVVQVLALGHAERGEIVPCGSPCSRSPALGLFPNASALESPRCTLL